MAGTRGQDDRVVACTEFARRRLAELYDRLSTVWRRPTILREEVSVHFKCLQLPEE